MSLPKAVFLDTSILDRQNFNFESAVLSSFIPAAKAKGLKLLLPDPTAKLLNIPMLQSVESALLQA